MRWIWILFVLLLAAPAQAQLRVQTTTDNKDGLLVLSGKWPSSCVPALEQLALEDGDLVVVATVAAGKQCKAGAVDYDFELHLQDLGEPLADGTYAVRYYVRNETTRAATLAGFDLVQLGQRPLIRPENGLWWAEPGGRYATSGPGVGFAIEVQDDQAVIMLNGYGPSGQAVWLLSTGQLENDVIRGNLTELADGQPFFGAFAEPQTAVDHGRLLVQFHSAARATLWLLGQAGDKLLVHPVSLVRFAFGPAPALAGRWLVMPQGDGSVQALDLIAVESGPAELILADASGAATVSCVLDSGRQASPPRLCVLDNGQTIDFDQIGLDRWRGVDREGRPWLAIRID